MQTHYMLRPSQYLTFVIWVATSLPLGLLFILPWGVMLRMCFGLLLIVACVTVLLRDARLSLAYSCIEFRLEENGIISLGLRDGRKLAGRLGAGGVIFPFVVLVNVRLEQGGRRSLVLLRDCMGADSFRHLRVALRWGTKQQDPISSI
jgi:hypothetical protein